MTPRVIAACFALTSFAAALVAGLYINNPAETVIVRALLVMLAAWLVGRLIGSVMTATVDQHIEAHRESRPIPSDELEDMTTAQEAVDQDVDRSVDEGVASAKAPSASSPERAVRSGDRSSRDPERRAA